MVTEKGKFPPWWIEEVRKCQSRLESLLETSINIATGFVISYLVWMFIVPIFWPAHKSTYSEAFGIVILFTIAAVIRSYFWRRFFEKEIHKFLIQYFRGE